MEKYLQFTYSFLNHDGLRLQDMHHTWGSKRRPLNYKFRGLERDVCTHSLFLKHPTENAISSNISTYAPRNLIMRIKAHTMYHCFP